MSLGFGFMGIYWELKYVEVQQIIVVWKVVKYFGLLVVLVFWCM